MLTQNKRLVGILTAATLLLLTPLVAMQFTNEVDWKLADFIAAAALLFGTGLLCEFVMRKVKKPVHRLILCATILFVLVLVWLELAVGIFGTPFAGS